MDLKKLQALQKVINGVENLSELGEANGDHQINWIAESMKVVLLAGNNSSHADLMSHHILNFLNELEMLNNEKSVREYFSQKEIIQN